MRIYLIPILKRREYKKKKENYFYNQKEKERKL